MQKSGAQAREALTAVTICPEHPGAGSNKNGD
jgi:hypothetical protein